MESTVAGAAAARVAAPSTLERWAPAAGSLFAVLFVAAVIIGEGLDIGYELPELTQNFASEDYQSTAGFVFILILLSALCFLWFLADLTTSPRPCVRSRRECSRPTAGGVFITALLVATTTLLAPLFNIGHSVLEGADPKTTATAYALLNGIALGLLGLAGIAGALLMGAAATVAYRGGLQPRWTVVLVVVGAVIAAIGTWVFFFPILLVVLWVLVASVRGTIAYRRGVLNPLR